MLLLQKQVILLWRVTFLLQGQALHLQGQMQRLSLIHFTWLSIIRLIWFVVGQAPWWATATNCLSATFSGNASR